MTLDSNTIAQRLGAKEPESLATRGDGAFGMAKLAALLKDRLMGGAGVSPKKGQVSIRWHAGPRVPISVETQKLLVLLATRLSTKEEPIDPVQLAAQILEDTLRKLTQDERTE